MKDKFTVDERLKVEGSIDDAIKWVESNPNAQAEEYEKKQKEIEEVFNPIITKIYGSMGGEGAGGAGGFPGGAGGFPGGFPGGPGGATGGNATGGKGPQVDDVD